MKREILLKSFGRQRERCQRVFGRRTPEIGHFQLKIERCQRGGSTNSGRRPSSAPSLQFFHRESRRERLLELLGLLTILNHQSVQVSAASHLELGVGSVLLDLDGFGVFPSSRQQEIFDLLNLLRHFHTSSFLPEKGLTKSSFKILNKLKLLNYKLPPC